MHHRTIGLSFMFVLLFIAQGAHVASAQSRASRYGISANLSMGKLKYAPEEIVMFSAFITNHNPYSVSVWDGCRATSVSTFSILKAGSNQVVFEWKPTGASCNYLYPVEINASQSYQLGAIGLGKNLTWDQRSGTADLPDGFVDPGKYVIAVTIVVAGFNPSQTPCQPSGKDCVQGIDHTFTLQASQDFQIGASINEFGAVPIIVILVVISAAVLTIPIAMHKIRRR